MARNGSFLPAVLENFSKNLSEKKKKNHTRLYKDDHWEMMWEHSSKKNGGL